MNIKKMLKNSKNNDVFAKRIESENKEYDGRYWIFIRSILGYRDEKDDEKNLIFRVKITDKKEVPKTKTEINQLEYVQTGIEILEEAKEYTNWLEKHNLQLYPDEYELLSIYQIQILPLEKNENIGELIYIGNYELDPPEKEYIANNIVFPCYEIWKNIDKRLIKSYEQYNKKDPKIYNHEFSAICKKNYLINKKIEEEVDRRTKEIIEKYGDQLEKIFANEPYTEDSLTYVGDGDVYEEE